MKCNLVLATLVLSFALSQPALALKTDRDQPAQIEADETEIDFKTGVRTLTNNVLVVQGTLRIKADKLVATYDTKTAQLKKAVATGSRARFKQRPDGKPDDVEGWGKKIVVDYVTNKITLIGRAALKQGASTAQGETIVYNMATDKLKVMGGSKFGVTGKDGKAPPRKIEDPFKDDPAPAAKTSKSTNSKKDKSSTEPSEAEPEVKQQRVEPVKAGRSRLILQPKKKVKPKPESDEKETQSDKDE